MADPPRCFWLVDITGYFTEIGKPEYRYSFQFTAIKPNLNWISPWVLQLAITDISSDKHCYRQFVNLFSRKIM